MNKELAAIIDHTNLKPDATPGDIERLCDEARKYGFCSVCVNSCYVPLAKKRLEGSDVKVCCVVGFPLGACDSETKSHETALAVRNGADEVDMVINVGMLKAGEFDYVYNDILSVVDAAHSAAVKVIIECCLLSDEQKIRACRLAVSAGAAFVKTSTGFSSGGATVTDVALMKKTVGGDAGVKAAGGIRTTEDAILMRMAGADRIGASASVSIVCDEDELKEENAGK